MVSLKLFVLRKRAIAGSIFFSVTLGLMAMSAIKPDISRFLDKSVCILDTNDQFLHVFLSRDDKYRIDTPSEKLPDLFIETLLLREDHYFYRHWGVNPVSLARSFYKNLRSQRIVMGGSTLTMQLARLLHPHQRSYWGKIKDIFFAFWLEYHFTKAEILNMYLTLVPLGGNIEGVEAATFAYFHKKTTQLAPHEIAQLIALIQSPNALRTQNPNNRILSKRNFILNLMHEHHLIPTDIFQKEKQAPLKPLVFHMPKGAPHFAWHLKQAQPNQHRIQTQIQPHLQKSVEALLKHHRLFLPHNTNASVIVWDIVTQAPVVYVGSTDYYDASHQGYVNYARAVRSPGSTLKPFIYALALEKGLFHPEDYILDTRRRFGAYYPRNFDKTEQGAISYQDALFSSLNTPAVALLDKIGVVRFLSFLSQNGVDISLPHDEQAGLSIALGGIGMTLEQLVTLYGAMANENTSFLSQRSRVFIQKALRLEVAPLHPMAVKTGTSYGHRDLLAMAFDNHYVIGVWVGKPQGGAIANETGGSVAVPLLKKIATVLPQGTLQTAQENPVHFQTFNHQPTHPLQLTFPVNQSKIAYAFNTERAIILTAEGGTQPYSWLIDSKPIADNLLRYAWRPEKPGFYKISVQDAQLHQADCFVEVFSAG